MERAEAKTREERSGERRRGTESAGEERRAAEERNGEQPRAAESSREQRRRAREQIGGQCKASAVMRATWDRHMYTSWGSPLDGSSCHLDGSSCHWMDPHEASQRYLPTPTSPQR